jgi:hypothetical protein
MRLIASGQCVTFNELMRTLAEILRRQSDEYLGMSSAIILKALADEGLTEAKLHSLEMSPDCDHRDTNGLPGASRTRHHEWGRWGYVAFVIKKAS